MIDNYSIETFQNLQKANFRNSSLKSFANNGVTMDTIANTVGNPPEVVSGTTFP